MGRIVTLGLIQMGMEADSGANLRKAVRMVGDAAKKGAQVVCLPELFHSPYFPQDKKAEYAYAEKIPGTATDALAKAARENKVVLVCGSVFEKDENGKMLGKYRKIHIPHDPKFYEQSYFLPGDLGYKVFRTKYGNISVMICFDQWYPEAARICALMGAEIIFYPTAIGTVKGVAQAEGDWHEAWETVQRGHAIANNVVVAAVNRAGTEKDMTFWGGSFICDAFGKVTARGGQKEEIIIGTCDLDHGKNVREGWGFLRNRKPETYSRLVEKKGAEKR
jgi:agmatine deiminase